MKRDRPEEPDLLSGALGRGGGKQAERAADREGGADDKLHDLIRFAVMFSVPAIEDRDEREETDANDRVEGDEPGGRQGLAHEDEVELPVAPDEIGVKDLVI